MDAVTLALLKALSGGSGGSGLPSTDSASAGDVLSLDNNKDPQWATPSGGGGVLVVNLTATETGYVCDKTAAEIMAGIENGAVVFKDSGEDYVDASYLINVSYSESDGYNFGVLSNGNNTQFTYTAASGTDYPSLTL